jgi:hypothetical protein
VCPSCSSPYGLDLLAWVGEEETNKNGDTTKMDGWKDGWMERSTLDMCGKTVEQNK